MHQVIDRATDIVIQYPEDTPDLWSKAADGQIFIQDQRGDLNAGHQIIQIVVKLGQLHDLALMFGIDRMQFFVNRLQLLVGALQFLVAGEQFLVSRLQFLVGCF